MTFQQKNISGNSVGLEELGIDSNKNLSHKLYLWLPPNHDYLENAIFVIQKKIDKVFHSGLIQKRYERNKKK